MLYEVITGRNGTVLGGVGEAAVTVVHQCGHRVVRVDRHGGPEVVRDRIGPVAVVGHSGHLRVEGRRGTVLVRVGEGPVAVVRKGRGRLGEGRNGTVLGGRITSYNVCYTKLLRVQK